MSAMVPAKLVSLGALADPVPIGNGGSGAGTQAAALAALLATSQVPVANGGTALAAVPTAATASTFAAWNATKDIPVSSGKAGCALFADFIPVDNTGNTLTDVFSHSITAGTLKTNGDCIIANYVATVNVSANAVSLRASMFSTVTNLIWTGTSASSDTYSLRVVIIRVSNTNVAIFATWQNNGTMTMTAGTNVASTGKSSLNLTTTAYTMKLSIQGTNDSDISAVMSSAQYFPA